jgi:hypothetical protein
MTIEEASLSRADIFIFVKAFSPKHLEFAKSLREAGRPYILDLCDNIFWDSYAPKRQTGNKSHFTEMGADAQATIVTCEALGNVVREHMPRCQPIVIPDASFSLQDHLELFAWFQSMQLARTWRSSSFLDSDEVHRSAHYSPRHWKARSLKYLASPMEAKAAVKRLQLRWAFKRAAPRSASRARRRKLLWFGKHGTTYGNAGMHSLNAALPTLSAINETIPIELAIVSNNRQKFRDHFCDLPFPTRYKKWSNEAVFSELMTSDVFLMPNETDGFSACKSANRAVMALAMGVPVVATGLGSLEPLANALVIDDWGRGLHGYLSDIGEREKALECAAQIISEVYAPKVVGQKWFEILSM